SKVDVLSLDGLTSITDAQAKFLSVGFPDELYLYGLTSITDEQAESLSKVDGWLELNGLTSITDAQLKSLRKVSILRVPSIIRD
ncbi:hypothetical protein OAI33_14975, partial [Pirellulaceae bacterium]|nr:hypothetical protein [Pirellulaceae bacterium]